MFNIFSVLVWFGTILLSKTQKKHPRTSHPQYQTCPLHLLKFTKTS